MSKLYDVAIIGCGPVGALAAHLCAKEGLATLVLEREANPYPLPRAVHLDHEMMRLFEAVGLDDLLARDMTDADGHLHIGADRGVIRYMGSVGDPRPFGWANDYFFYQPELEQHLRSALAAHAKCDLRLGAEFLGLQDSPDGVTIQARTASGVETFKARRLLACDGARSAVRKCLGVELDDLDFEEPWLVIDADVRGPVSFPALTGVPADANLQRLSVMMCDPKRPATIVPGRGTHRRWEFMLLPGETDEEMMQPHKVRDLVGQWLEGVEHTIVRAATYRFHGLVAKTWKLGNVFLAGDAAHQTPPFFGQGMCHGLRDVANLAWKLGLVQRGRADERLLETYQIERDPHVRAVISAAVEAGRYICVLDPKAAAERDSRIRAQRQQGDSVRTAADLIPPIRDGIVAAASACAGQRFVQPLVATEAGPRLLDKITGGGWRVFCVDSAAAQEARVALARASGLPDMSIIDISQVRDGGALNAWLGRVEARYAIVRPDFYVYGTSAETVSSLLELLAPQLLQDAAARTAA
jgi:3-(3-hydroxy-phenyl)propionate hydroxylase